MDRVHVEQRLAFSPADVPFSFTFIPSIAFVLITQSLLGVPLIICIIIQLSIIYKSLSFSLLLLGKLISLVINHLKYVFNFNKYELTLCPSL